MHRIAVVVPAYNEESSISRVVKQLAEVSDKSGMGFEIVVVNDCSTDSTGGIINQLPCHALHLPINLGIGGAMQAGFKYARNKEFDYVFQIDGDGQHPPAEIPKLWNLMFDKKLDVVIGSRFLEKQGFQSTVFRRAGISYFKFLNYLLTGQHITDSTSGFRLINRNALEIVCGYYPDEYPEPESIILYASKGLSIGEVPVVMREREGGSSSINNIRSLYYMVKVTLAILYTFIRLKT